MGKASQVAYIEQKDKAVDEEQRRNTMPIFFNSQLLPQFPASAMTRRSSVRCSCRSPAAATASRWSQR
jgi:hypothetical protein